MDQPSTCGEGLAQSAVLPTKLGELAAAMATVLEVHMTSLDLADDNARPEYDAYRRLVNDYRAIAAQLQATGAAMASYRDLPMGRHDEQVLSSPAAVDAFEHFVTAEQELLALLQTRVAQEEQMLREMSEA
jgi:hypothetical protein